MIKSIFSILYINKILQYKFIILSFHFLFIGCSASIQVVQDQFKGATIVKLDLDHEAKIENPNKSVYSRGGQYAKEIKNGLSSPIALLIRLQGSETMAALGPEAYVKVDQKMFKLSLMDTNYSVNQETIRTQTAPGFIGGPGYGYYSPGFISSSRTLTVTSNICSGKLTFTKEIENEILSAKVLQYRFYSANDAVDLFVSDSDLELIKKFIRHKGEIQK